MIQHHPSPEILSNFVHGHLHHAHSLVVSCHVQWCESCTKIIATEEIAVGVVLEELLPEKMREDAMERALEEVTGLSPAPHPPAAHVPHFLKRFEIPPQLSELEIRKRWWLSPSVWIAPLNADAELGPERLFLLWAKPRTLLPRHSHAGIEFAFILHGRYSDGSNDYRKGDFIRSGAGRLHAPVTLGSTDCLCLISSDAPMRLDSTSARLVQLLTGNRF